MRKFKEDYVRGTDPRERCFSIEIRINHGYYHQSDVFLAGES